MRSFTRLFPLIWCMLLGSYVLAGIALVPLHGDESTQIYMGRDFYYQFVQGNLDQVRYRDPATLSPEESTQQHLRLLNGTIPKYLFGFGAWASGYEIEAINDQWSWGSGWDWNHNNGHVPTEDLLNRMRLISAILFALGIPVILAIGWQLSGQIAGYSAATLYALHPALLLNGRRAMMEGGLTFFSLLSVLLGILVLRKRTWWSYLLLGVVSGLTVATKHTGVVTVMAIFAVCGLYFIWNRQQIVRNILSLALAGILALGIFYALNPAWWYTPIERIGTVLQARSELLEGQTEAFGKYPALPQQLMGFIRQAFDPAIMYAEVPVDDFVNRQAEKIQQYESSGLAGVHPGLFFMIVTSTIGLIQLWRRRTHAPDIHLLLAVWLLAMVLLTMFITPLEWQRYYLPIHPIILLLAGSGISFLSTGMIRIIKRPSPAT